MKKAILTFVLLVAMASFSYAISFDDIERWQPEKQYHRGDVVRLDYDLYVSLITSKGLVPSTQTRRWRLIEYSNIHEFKTRKLYRIGDVVSYDGNYYISSHMNMSVKNPRFDDERRWVEFTHPGIIYDLPPVPDDTNADESLVGIDANHNDIRDDYELAIVFSDLPAPVKDSALSAGKAYGALMKVADSEVDGDGALEILHDLVLAKACRTRMRQLHEGVAWQESTYFNTLDRIEAKFKLQNTLGILLGESGYDLPREQDPCAALAGI